MTEKAKIQDLVNEERLSMCQKHNQVYFNSLHEAYSVTLEEVEEAKDEMRILEDELTWAWQTIKTNQTSLLETHIKKIKERGIKAIQEAIQVCACCDKMLSSMKKDGAEND